MEKSKSCHVSAVHQSVENVYTSLQPSPACGVEAKQTRYNLAIFSLYKEFNIYIDPEG